MRVLVSGAQGFIGQHLMRRLELNGIATETVTRCSDSKNISDLLKHVDWVYHLAGVNRSEDPTQFHIDNIELTKSICGAVRETGKKIPIVFASSIHARANTDYGLSKLGAEKCLLELKAKTGNPVFIFRLQNVFGSGTKPFYNSVVATFCYCIARNIPIRVDDKDAVLNLIHVNQVIDKFVNMLSVDVANYEIYQKVHPVYSLPLLKLVERLSVYKSQSDQAGTERRLKGFNKLLHETYRSYIPEGKKK